MEVWEQELVVSDLRLLLSALRDAVDARDAGLIVGAVPGVDGVAWRRAVRRAIVNDAHLLPCGCSADRVENDEVAADEHSRVCLDWDGAA